jgi:hypothetical protein
MKEPTAQQKQQYERLRDIFAQARQRYLAAGGEPQRAADNRHLTDEEKKEACELGTQLFGVEVKNGYVHCQGRSWEIPQKQKVKNN